MPLAVCFLALLTLSDRFAPSLLRPKLDPNLERLVGIPSVYEGVIAEPPRLSESGVKIAVWTQSSKVQLTFKEPPRIPLEREDRVRFEAKLKRPVRYKNPGSFDYRDYLARQGILLTGFLEDPADLQVVGKRDGWFRSLDRLREEVRKLVDAAVPPPASGFLTALLVGDASGVSDDLRADFQATGTSHLIAVSGQQIAIVGLASFFILTWLLRRSERILLSLSVRKLALVLSLIPVAGYTLVSGAPPSAIRAAVLVGLIAFAALSDREQDTLSSLAAGAIFIGVLDTAAPFSASFQLSFLAVLGILAFRRRADPPSAAPSFVSKYVVGPFWMSVGATLATAPLVAYRFHEISLTGIAVNVMAVPMAGLLLVAGFAGVLLALAVPFLGAPVLHGVGSLTGFFLTGLHAAARGSRSADLVLSFYPTEFETALCFLAVGLLVWLRWYPETLAFWRRPRPAAAFASLAVIILFAASFRWPHSDLEVVFLDVGQGDAALVLTPSGKSLLVDAGGFLIPGDDAQSSHFDVGREVVVPYLKRRGLKKIDAVLLSHPHPDHFGGLAAVFENFPVGEFWWNGQKFPDSSFDRLLESIRAHGTPMKVLKTGDAFPWAECGIEVYYPGRIEPARSINDNSLVVRLAFGDASVLFSGDIEKEGEGSLADRAPIASTVLKIPHHGSRTSSSVPFIDTVKPAVAVASLGEDNLFGFPHEGVLEKYQRRDVAIYRTDRNGAVTVRLSPEFPRKSPSIRTVFSGE